MQTANPTQNQILYLQTFLTSLIANKQVYNEIKEGVNKVLKDALEHKEALDIKLEAYDQVIKDIEERLERLSERSDRSDLSDLSDLSDRSDLSDLSDQSDLSDL